MPLSNYLCNPFACFFSPKAAPIAPVQNTPSNPQLPSTTMLWTRFYRYTLDDVRNILNQRELITVPKNKGKYEQITFDVMCALHNLGARSITELNVALSRFNSAFANTVLWDRNIANQTRSIGLDDDLIEAIIKQLSTSTVNTQTPQPHVINNILGAIMAVYEQMNQHRLTHYLPYHNPRHGVEMLLDSLYLIAEDPSILDVCLLQPLCALAHDVIFQHQRVDDERSSADWLINFLRPVLNKLNKYDCAIIMTLVLVLIPGATTPCLLNRSPSGTKLATMESVYKVADGLFSVQQDTIRAEMSYKVVLRHAEVMELLDTKRTWIRQLHQDDGPYEIDMYEAPFPYNNASWIIIEDALSISVSLPLRKRIAQSLRVLSEMTLLGNHDKPLGLYAFYYQSDSENNEIILTGRDVQLLADKINGTQNDFSEMQFSIRMRNSYPSLSFGSTLEDIEKQYQKILPALYHFLTGPVALKDKIKVTQALMQVASEQDGCYVTLDKILQNCQIAEKLLTPQTEYSDPIEASRRVMFS